MTTILIHPGDITQLASEGYITMQIPQYVFGTIADVKAHDTECVEVPLDWFIELKSSKQPAVGRESGFTFLTRKGWDANKEEIRSVFEKAIEDPQCNRGARWVDFEQHAKEHFTKVDESIKKRLTDFAKKVAYLRDLKA